MVKKSSLSSPSVLSYENLITDAIGELGRAQILICLVHFSPLIMLSWSMIAISISAGRTDWWKVSRVYNETGICFQYSIHPSSGIKTCTKIALYFCC